MPLNIKNERVTRLAFEVAAATGGSLTDAVGKALESRLEELHRQNRRVGLSDRLMELGRRTASHAPVDWLKQDFDDELYDERGLPK